MSRLYSTLICKCCGQRVFMPRPKEWQNEPNIKIMFCGKCKSESEFEEQDQCEWGTR